MRMAVSRNSISGDFRRRTEIELAFNASKKGIIYPDGQPA